MAYVALSDPGSLHFKVSLPAIGGQQCIEMQFRQFSKNSDISVVFMRNCQTYISMYYYPPIAGRMS